MKTSFRFLALSGPAWRGALFVGLYIFLGGGLAHAQIKKEILADGVEHWYVPSPSNGQSAFTKMFLSLYNVISPAPNTLPFGKSVAFLAGVSKYRYLSPQLPSVQNDIEAMREFLLEKAGFDEVYIAMDSVVTRDLIEQYVKSTLIGKMHKNDRLLFYYSGHGGDGHGDTGYMLFGNAKPGQFFGDEVLAVHNLRDWGQEVPIDHMLFILDSCASGLGIVPKSSVSDTSARLLQTLSGDGSRTVLTAGTAAEATFAEDDRNKHGRSFFTKAFLDAFETRSLADQKSGFITIADLYAQIQIEMAAFRVEHGESTTPQMWPLQDKDHQHGTFVFLNPRAKSPALTSEQASALGVKIVSKGDAPPSAESDTGTLEIRAGIGGELMIDGKDMGYMDAGQAQFLQRTVGHHAVQLGSAESKEVTLVSGQFTLVGFGIRSPFDTSGKAKVGFIEMSSKLDQPGEILVDTYPAGHLPVGGKLVIVGLTVGMHDCRIFYTDPDGKQRVVQQSLEVLADTTTPTVVRPAAPTGLKAVVQ